MDDEEFSELYRRLSDHVFRFAARRLPRREQAMDVVGDTFEIAWSKRSSLSSEPAKQSGYIFGIAKNRIAQEHQRAQRKHHDNRFVADFPHASQATPAPDVADQIIEADSARRVLHQLSDDDRELLDLAFVTGISTQDAAKFMGITLTAYTSRVSRLNQRIASLITAETSHFDPQKTGHA